MYLIIRLSNVVPRYPSFNMWVEASVRKLFITRRAENALTILLTVLGSNIFTLLLSKMDNIDRKTRAHFVKNHFVPKPLKVMENYCFKITFKGDFNKKMFDASLYQKSICWKPIDDSKTTIWSLCQNGVLSEYQTSSRLILQKVKLLQNFEKSRGTFYRRLKYSKGTRAGVPNL